MIKKQFLLTKDKKRILQIKLIIQIYNYRLSNCFVK